MDRKGGISGHILTGLISVLVSACTPISQYAEIKIDIAGKEFRAKASMPQEEKISDMNILIFNSRGDLEHSVFSNEQNCRVSLLKGESYTFCAFISDIFSSCGIEALALNSFPAISILISAY